MKIQQTMKYQALILTFLLPFIIQPTKATDDFPDLIKSSRSSIPVKPNPQTGQYDNPFEILPPDLLAKVLLYHPGVPKQSYMTCKLFREIIQGGLGVRKDGCYQIRFRPVNAFQYGAFDFLSVLRTLAFVSELSLNNDESVLSKVCYKGVSLNKKHESTWNIFNSDKRDDIFVHLQNLTILDISNTNFQNCRKLNALINLKRLYMVNTPVRDISNFTAFVLMTKLNLSKTDISKLPAFKDMMNLRELLLNKMIFLKDISGLRGLQGIKVIYLRDCPKLKDISILGSLLSLEDLCISLLPKIKHCKYLRALTNLTCLNLLDLTVLKDLRVIENMIRLQLLGLAGCANINDFSSIANLVALEQIDLRITNIQDLSCLQNLEHLEVVRLKGCKKLSEKNIYDQLGSKKPNLKIII